MKSHYDQFIGMYSDVFPEHWCKHMIDYFERSRNYGIIHNRQDAENALKSDKEDESIFLNVSNHDFGSFGGENAIDIFWKGLQTCFDEYTKEYSVLKHCNITCSSVKIQKTSPGGGYHVWHSEQGNGEHANRSLVYAVYLNNIEEAGETEFLYQKLRVPPKENCCLIWPAAYTHAHRGNVVHGSRAKYIITGWFKNE